MKISDLESYASSALLGPGYTGSEFALISPLRVGAAEPSLVYAPYETAGDDPLCFGGEPSLLSSLELDVPPEPLEISLGDEGHRDRVEEIRLRIAAGEVYQVNLTLRARFRCSAGPALLATLLRHGTPPFAAWVRLPDGEEFVSASPELFFAIDGRKIRCQPMKGTARPGESQGLEGSEKDRAELAMITDLVRNDLTPACEPRSVRVACERKILVLPYALQTVSEVEGTLRPGLGAMEALAALHPGGSITGAPKRAAMEMISLLEPTRRGPYCGALGLIRGPHAAFGLLIRTARREAESWVYGVGGGIVWESCPEAELEEVRLKLGAMR
jgi:para-aminobenzoate synthetase component I